MKYLVIGDASSMHIFNFISTVLLPCRYEVHLLTLSTRPIRKEYRDFYRENHVTVYSVAEKGYENLEKKDRFNRMLQLLYKLRLMKAVPTVDICHVQSVYKTALLMVLQNKKKFKHLILSYWGGDIEDKTDYVVNLRKKCFAFADAITVTVQQTYNEFHALYGHQFDEKLHICRFATNGLNCIHDLSGKTTREACRKAYGIPQDKICITCGYSAYAEQHQDLCLLSMQKLPDELRKKIVAIVPMQYGRFNDAYITRVKEIAAQCDFKTTVLEKYVPFEMSAKLAIATDVYLHLRDTDAFSNALKEHVYAGSYVIKGDWLLYPELEEMHAAMQSISTFDLLTETLQNVLKDFHISEEITLFAPIYELYATQAIQKQWLHIIHVALNDEKECQSTLLGEKKKNE